MGISEGRRLNFRALQQGRTQVFWLQMLSSPINLKGDRAGNKSAVGCRRGLPCSLGPDPGAAPCPPSKEQGLWGGDCACLGAGTQPDESLP